MHLRLVLIAMALLPMVSCLLREPTHLCLVLCVFRRRPPANHSLCPYIIPSNSVPTVPNPTTSPSLPECLDTPNWFDSGGDGCDWYEEMEERCGIVGFEGDMGSALDNCCACFNYDPPFKTIAPTQVDSNQPTYQPTDISSSLPTLYFDNINNNDYEICYTEKECKDIFNEYDVFTEFVSGDYPFHGCFSSYTTPKYPVLGYGWHKRRNFFGFL